MTTALSVQGVSKQYRLGEVGTGTLAHDLNRWFALMLGREDPYARVGQENRRDKAASSPFVWALRDIDLDVAQGEILGVIGANGAGKSTLLKLVSRITSPTTGVIKVRGRIASLLEVGTGMHPDMTARENIYLNGAILGMGRREVRSKFDAILDFAGCRMYVDTPIKRFSSGMRVRLGFAVAAFLEPEVLVVDEVLAVGDAEFQERAIGKIQDIATDRNRTVVFVSHNMASVEKLCTRTVVMKHGRIDFSGDTREAISRYYQELSVTATERIAEASSASGLDFERIHVGSPDQFSEGHFPIGADLDFVVDLTLPKFGSSFELRLGVDAESGARVTTLSTHHSKLSGELRRMDERRVSLRCRANGLNLVPGSYYVFVNCVIDGSRSVFKAERIASFRVVESNFHTFGRRVFPGVITCQQEWDASPMGRPAVLEETARNDDGAEREVIQPRRRRQG